jgi:hypothetical protein
LSQLAWEKATLSQSVPNLIPMFLVILCEFVAIGGFRLLKTANPAKLLGS